MIVKKKVLGILAVVVISITNVFSFTEIYGQNILNEFRGVWISTVYNADFPENQESPEKQQQEFIEKLDKLKDLGINAVLVQVRPKGDAFYESELNPWSSVITGTENLYPDYDVMEFMIEETHKRNMEFHAWLNPYRVTTKGTDFEALSDKNMAKQNPEWTITHNEALYYNPELIEVKEYICNTVKEIIVNYNVDGIHFDDYFYPSKYPLSEGQDGDGEEANARRNHVNDMVEMVYSTIKNYDSNIAFGISPMGIWKNDGSDQNGSITKGSEGYYTVFADSTAWIKNGHVDYIAPQIYWQQGNEYADYETLLYWWSKQVENTDVKLYIGQGIYKDVVATEIVEQLTLNENYLTSGSIFFSMRDLLDNRENSGTKVQEYYKEFDSKVLSTDYKNNLELENIALSEIENLEEDNNENENEETNKSNMSIIMSGILIFVLSVMLALKLVGENKNKNRKRRK